MAVSLQVLIKTQLSSEPVKSTVPVTHDYTSNKKNAALFYLRSLLMLHPYLAI